MSVGASLDQQWARIRGRLKDEVGEIAYRSWLQPLSFAGIRGGEVRIVVPTRFMRDWVLTHYADRIRNLWAGENPDVLSIDVVVASANAPSMLMPELTSDGDAGEPSRDSDPVDGAAGGGPVPPAPAPRAAALNQSASYGAASYGANSYIGSSYSAGPPSFASDESPKIGRAHV